MKTIIFGLSIYFLGNLLLTMASPTDLTRSISQFSTDLYSNVIDGQTSNVIISPFSVHMAVSLALMGAKGNTEAEMLTGLRLSGTKPSIAQDIHQLIEPIQNNSMLKVANKVYVMESYRINPEFDIIAKKQFYSEAQTLNFAKATESASTINKWVEGKTNDKIKDLIAPDALGADTRMVLVNAIYFKGFWEHQFKKDRTDKAAFYTSDTDSVQVDMMHVKEHFLYGEFTKLDAKVIELPYKDSDMSMLIMLPNSKTGLSKLEADLKTVDISELKKEMYKTEVDVSIPKFKIEFELSLVDALKKMGMRDMFSHSAKFGGLLETTEPIYISDIVHKAFIEVNEEGAEAAAATGIIAVVTSAIIGPRTVFKADHPFKFLLKKNTDILFMGMYNNA